MDSDNLNLRPQPSGFLATLTDEQRTAALAHTGGDTHPQPSGETRADALRAAGWSVAVHNDYRLNGEAHTFWLWTHPDGRWVKGEGRTDEDALSQCAALIRPAPVASGGQHSSGEVEEALSCLADYDHTGRLERAVRSALRPKSTLEADAGREAIHKVIHELWQLLDDGETGADGTVTIDQARYQEVSKSMDELEALVPDSVGPFWGGFPVNYFWGLK